MRGSKVEAKKTGKFRRNNPVVQTTFEGNEELYRAFSGSNCNKCNGTGRKKKVESGVFIDTLGHKQFNGSVLQPCKCVPLCLFGY